MNDRRTLTLPGTIPAEEEPYDFLESARRVHEVACYDFPTVFSHHFDRGYVIKTPIMFMMAKEDPNRPDAWYVWWLEIHPDLQRHTPPHKLLAIALRHMPYHRPFVGWARELKGRSTVKYYSTDRLLAFTRRGRVQHA